MAAAVAGKAALALAPLVIGAFHRSKKGPNRQAILQRYRASRPEAYVTPADQAASERTRARISGAAQNAASQARQMNARNVTARGLTGPAAAALESQASDIAAQGAEQGATAAAGQEYLAGQSNLGYARNQNDTAFGAELGLANQDYARNSAQDATFWNSMLDTIPSIAGAFSPSSAPTATGIVGRGIVRDPGMLSTDSYTQPRAIPRPTAVYR